ncbi:hypothetical protein ACHHYP_13635 [Achlya hypogyna]|uniref:Secreted protein n=1 Tax=Achlya hypogyna TaxID=1202772 RepID=A0A0A7CPC0_ACHHY|nr:secreted protein [Achlya hypogyna]OQR96770.1 hypothetical protein ACHHYP_13635 [Achlya hypogyna]
MKITALLAFATVAAATQAEHCTKADFEAIGNLHGAHYAACTADLGLTPAEADKLKVVTDAQAQAFIKSDNCKALYGDMQEAAIANGCLELSYAKDITWSMVTSMLEIASYPKVSARCDAADLQKAMVPLFQDQNIMPCFSATGLYANLFTKTMPTEDQITAIGENSFCRALYNDAIGLVKGLPHCTFDNGGNDVHAFAKLDFDSFVAWAHLGSEFLHEQVAPQLMTLAMSAIAPPAPASESHTLLVGGSVAAGFLLAVVAMYAHKKVTQEPARYGESTGLLHI